MPNHVTNRLTVIGSPEQINQVFDFIKIEKETSEDEVFGIGTIDFNKITPMPNDLKIVSDGHLMPLENEFMGKEPFKAVMDNLRKHCNQDEFDEKTLKNFLKGCENYVRYGFATWYEWSVQNWGTKWNAYGQPDKRRTPNAIYFETAWSCPKDLIKKLSLNFHGIEFEIAWADEDLGYNIGIIKYRDGEIIGQTIPEGGSLDAKKLYFEITKETLEEKNMNENYEYIDGD
jgi:hypothetical protein